MESMLSRLLRSRREILAILISIAAAFGGTSLHAEDVMRHESFYVGGAYVPKGEDRVMKGQMFVEVLTPHVRKHPYPLVLIHGGGQSAVNWMTTPDGRQGWAQWFAAQGWKVVMIDVPARGRSAWQPGINGELRTLPVASVVRAFTAPESFDDYPQARLHTQWPGGPGKGHPGDPAFDQFYASQLPFLGREEAEELTLSAGLALLDRLGPAVLLAHSQAGLNAWSIADARPDLVKGIVAIEPNGPPFKDVLSRSGKAERPWGLTTTPLAFDPPLAQGQALAFEREKTAQASGLVPCWVQAKPARRLHNIAGIPVLIVTAQASYHAPYDHCTSRFLSDAGVRHEFVRLEDQGIHGNGHMVMLELNNQEIAAFLNGWMSSHIPGRFASE